MFYFLVRCHKLGIKLGSTIWGSQAWYLQYTLGWKIHRQTWGGHMLEISHVAKPWIMLHWWHSGWWFATWILLFHNLGIIIQTDFHIFSEGLKPPTSIDAGQIVTTKACSPEPWNHALDLGNPKICQHFRLVNYSYLPLICWTIRY